MTPPGALERSGLTAFDWYAGGLEVDVRPRMFGCSDAGLPFALATIVAREGGPRPVGSQMLVSEVGVWGFLSGGCIEADVALHALEVLGSGEPVRLTYGRDSPFLDIRLPCGGRIDVLVERVAPDDHALHKLRLLTAARQPAWWRSDGWTRSCQPISPEQTTDSQEKNAYEVLFLPGRRLIVLGCDPFALEIARLGVASGWDTLLVHPFGPTKPPPICGLRYSRESFSTELQRIRADRWTALAIATHDAVADADALLAAAGADLGYVGLLGSRRRLPERLAAFENQRPDGSPSPRLHAPIGLPIDARSPAEVAIATVAEIVAVLNQSAEPVACDAAPGAAAGPERSELIAA